MPAATIEPRIARTRAVVFDATLEIVAERGFAGVSIDATAQRAGVARSTIYRDWDSRDELLTRAVETVLDRVEAMQTGELRSDLVTVAAYLADFCLRHAQVRSSLR